MFPNSHRHDAAIGQQSAFSVQGEPAAGVACLDREMAMAMGVANERHIHVEWGNPAEATPKMPPTDVNIETARHNKLFSNAAVGHPAGWLRNQTDCNIGQCLSRNVDGFRAAVARCESSQ